MDKRWTKPHFFITKIPKNRIKSRLVVRQFPHVSFVELEYFIVFYRSLLSLASIDIMGFSWKHKLF